MRTLLYIYLFLTFLGPLTIALSGRIDFRQSYMTANRDSIKLAPDPTITKEAIFQIYTARAFNWRGLFSEHTWIAIKNKNATTYTVFQVLGWRFFRGLSPISVADDIPDRRWFDADPKVLVDIRGPQAEALIPKIIAAARDYPFPGTYITWPGPNSNTFTAEIVRQLPELQLALPSNSLGKDFVSLSQLITKAPSNTGYQVSLFGLLGIMIAKKEGLEINILGLVYGISPSQRAIKLPGFGDIVIG